MFRSDDKLILVFEKHKIISFKKQLKKVLTKKKSFDKIKKLKQTKNFEN